MKKSRHDRKIYNQGRHAGYNEGYIQGLHDGNPFTLIAEAAAELGRSMVEALKDPDVVKALADSQQAEDAQPVNDISEKAIKPPTCLTDPERYEELLERYKEE